MNYDSESEKKAYEQLDQILERAKKSGSITFNEVDDAFSCVRRVLGFNPHDSDRFFRRFYRRDGYRSQGRRRPHDVGDGRQRGRRYESRTKL